MTSLLRRPGRPARPIRALSVRAAVSGLAVALVCTGSAGIASGVPGRAATRSPAAPVPVVIRYGWPLADPLVVRGFDPPPRPWLPGHRGVDLAGSAGEPVLAAGPGVVAFAGTVAGVGVLSIDHPGGLRTTYQPVRPAVPAGRRVATGQRVASLLPGHLACPRPVCLHWGLRRGARYLDPRALLGAARVRLLPWPDTSPPGEPRAAGRAARRRASGRGGRRRPARWAGGRPRAVPLGASALSGRPR